MFQELRLDTMKEGRFLAAGEADFHRLVQRMIEHRGNHPGQAAGAKGKLTLEIEVECVQGGGYAVTAVSKLKLPGRPAMVAWPVRGDADLGGPTLFVPDEVETTNPVPGAESPAISEG